MREQIFIPISENYESDLSSFLCTGEYDHLLKKGLIALPILKDGGIRFNDDLFIINPKHLSPSQRSDAAILLLEVSEKIRKSGHILCRLDYTGLAFNNKGKIIFVGYNSIRHNLENKLPLIEFFEYHLGPLQLIKKFPEITYFFRNSEYISLEGYFSITHPYFKRMINYFDSLSIRLIGREYFNHAFFRSSCSKYIAYGYYIDFILCALIKVFIKNRKKNNIASSDNNLISKIFTCLHNLRIDKMVYKWTNYYQSYDLSEIFNSYDAQKYFCKDLRATKIQEILNNEGNREGKNTLLDIGSNQGYFSLLASCNNYNVIAGDYDIGAIDSLYVRIKKCNYIHNITPQLVDFTKLEERYCNKIKSDIVLALGFTHHMRLVENMSWRNIVNILSALTISSLITEFKMHTSASGKWSEIKEDLNEDYKINNFLKELNNKFNHVETINNDNSENKDRVLIFCKK